MGGTLSHVFDALRDGLTAFSHWAGPWALPGLGVGAVVIAYANRARIVSPGGLIFLLAALAVAVVVKAVQLGRF